MIRSIFTSTPGKRSNLTLSEIPEALSDPNGLIWIDLNNPTPQEIHSVLEEIFHFHPLTIEDCLSSGYQTPKIDDFGDYIFIIAHAIPPDARISDQETLELNLYLGSNYVVTTYHAPSMPPVDETWNNLSRDERLISNGSDFLCHRILDRLVDDYLPLIDSMDTELEKLEDQVLARPTPQVLERVLTLKHDIMFLRRIISPQREVINRLSRDDFPMIDRQSRIYFRDIYDHLVRVQDLTESLRDIVSSVLDIYLNSTSLRLNEIMKALTIVSTIFLPMSFVAGVYGMNFHFMPELTWKLGYLFVWIVFVVIFAGMLLFFKRRNWF